MENVVKTLLEETMEQKSLPLEFKERAVLAEPRLR